MAPRRHDMTDELVPDYDVPVEDGAEPDDAGIEHEASTDEVDESLSGEDSKE